VLLGNLGIWAATTSPGELPPSTIAHETAVLLGRSALSDTAYDQLPLPTGHMDVFKYLESNLLGNPRLDAIKLFVPLFGAIFGA
jgi:hypothetical protein